jgi:hypothetical protein
MPGRSEDDRDALRQRHRVRRVTSPEEGTAAAHLPNGVFGFTGSPALAAPLFSERRYRNFEVHRRLDGSTVLLGFVTAAEAAAMDQATRQFSVTVFPDAEGEAQTLVVIPHAQIVSHRAVRDPNSAGVVMEVLLRAEVRS